MKKLKKHVIICTCLALLLTVRYPSVSVNKPIQSLGIGHWVTVVK